MLRAIPQMHTSLVNGTWLHLPVNNEDAGRIGGTSTPGAPANLHTLGLVDPRSDVRAVLGRWLDQVSARLSNRPNTRTHRDVQAVCEQTAKVLPWCARHLEHQPMHDLVADVRTQHRMLRQATVGGRAPRRPVPCPVLWEDGPCGGYLLLHQDGSVSCSDCDATWAYDDWTRLALLVVG